MKIYTVGLALTATLLFCNQETVQAEEAGRFLAQKLQKHKKNHKNADEPPVAPPADEILYDYVEDQDCIPELEAVLQDDGTYVYEDTHNCDRLLAKKNKKNSKKSNKKKNNKPKPAEVQEEDPQPPVDPADEILYDYVEDQDCIPELEAVLQDDGTYVYEDTHNCDRLLAKKNSKKSNKKKNHKPQPASAQEEDPQPPVDPADEILYDYVEDQDCIPELEAVLQDDGTYVYEDTHNCDRLLAKKGKKSSKKSSKKKHNKPQPASAQEEDPQPPVDPADEILYDYVEDQDCIPELEAVLQDDGTYVYEDTHNCDK